MKKAGELMLGVGFWLVLIFGSGIDCPENNMMLISGGMVLGLILMVIGAKMAGAWR